MKNTSGLFCARAIVPVLLAMSFFTACAQINATVPAVIFGPFSITSLAKSVNGNNILYINIFKNDSLVVADSTITDISSCQGFSFPAVQPLSGYFIFSKHAKHAGKTYIFTQNGDCTVIGGGMFWVAPKNKLLFIMAEKDNINLVVFSLQQMKTVFEKFSCDEFTGWYYYHGKYFGKVIAECGDEIKAEKEVNEWMSPVQTEQFDIKLNSLNEMHLTAEQVEHARPLIQYADCK